MEIAVRGGGGGGPAGQWLITADMGNSTDAAPPKP